jgi:site-specific recombinase XerD
LQCKDLIKDRIIKTWLSGIGAKKTTRAIYVDDMRAYTEFLQKTPYELLTEAEAEIRAGLLMRERNIMSYLIDFREYLEESGAAPMSIKGRLTGVRSFYKFYGIEIPVMPRSATKARPLLKHREIPTKDEIREVLSGADVLEKALVLCGVASGLAVNEISNLKIDDFLKGYDKEDGFTTLHLIREKVGYEFYTFLTPEASQAVLDYIAWRSRTSEKKDPVRQEQLLKQRFVLDKEGKPTGYLFIRRYIPSKYLKLKDSSNPTDRKKAEEMRKLKPRSIQKIYRELNERVGKSHENGEWRKIRSHNIRKFTSSTLLANGAQMYLVDYWLGHQVDATHDAYFRADPNALKQEYMKYAPYLTIEKPFDIVSSPEWQNLKDENQRLKALAEKYFVDGLELMNVKSELRQLQLQALPEKERNEAIKQDIINFVKELKPKNESEIRFKEQMIKLMGITD